MALKRAISLQEYLSRQKKKGKRSSKPTPSKIRKKRWSPSVLLGDRLRVQAIDGYRAAVITLRPGLYLVSEVKSEALEFGFIPLLLPLLSRQMAKAAVQALRHRRSGESAPAPAAVQLPAEMVRWVKDVTSKPEESTETPSQGGRHDELE